MGDKDVGSMTLKEKNGLYLAYNTVLEMAEARNFDINKRLSREEFMDKVIDESTNMHMVNTYKSNDKTKNEKFMIVFIVKTKRTDSRKSKLTSIIPDGEKYNGQIVFILKDKPQKTGTLKTTLKAEQEKYNTSGGNITRIDVFSYMSMLFNITKHILQPKFDMVTNEELSHIVESYTKKNDNSTIKEFKTRLPKLMVNDPIAEFYGMNIGDVVKVTRYDPQYNIAVTYRVVV